MPVDDCAVRLDGMERGDGTTLRRRRSGPVSQEVAIRYLRELSHPATRVALFAVNERWSAVVTNLRDGSDFADYTYSVSRHLRTRVCRAVDDDPGPPRRVGPYKVHNGYPVRIFELHDTGDQIRSIYCGLDGSRWAFETAGEPLPAEAEFGYTASPKKDRLTSDNLQTLLRSLGVDKPVPQVFASTNRFHLFKETRRHWWQRGRIAVDTCTTEQADDPGYGYLTRAMGWVRHMNTHASSAVFDLTCAVLLSPHLRDQATPHLRRARQVLGEAEFQRLTHEADEFLRKK